MIQIDPNVLEQAGAEILGPVVALQDELHILAADTGLDAASLDVDLKGESVYPLADALIAGAVPFMFTTGYDQAPSPEPHARVRRLQKLIEPQTMLLKFEKLLRPWVRYIRSRSLKKPTRVN